MKIEPNTLALLKGEVGLVSISELDPESEVQYTVAPTGACSVVLNYNDDHTEANVLITGLNAGVCTVIFAQSSNTVSVIVSVTEVSEYTPLTADGSGTGNDGTVFGRQYIINQNLGRVDDVINVIQRNVNTIKNLSISNQVTNAASLAAIATNLVFTIDMLVSLKKLVKATGKNTLDL